MIRKIAALAAAAALAASLAACGGNGPSVSACADQIVARPVNGPWPMCKGLSQAQLWQATEDAMARGARG